MNKNFIYGIASVKFGEQLIGYIEKGSWDWGGQKPESVDIEAEQSPTFNLIQLDYKNLKAVLGGKLSPNDETPTAWEAPEDLIQLSGKWEIKFVSGQTMTIPNGVILANLGGKLTLTEVSKVECQLKINKPTEGGAPYKIADAAG